MKLHQVIDNQTVNNKNALQRSCVLKFYLSLVCFLLLFVFKKALSIHKSIFMHEQLIILVVFLLN